MDADWVLETLQVALTRHGKPEIINSDQGSQFTCKKWVEYLKEEQILISMDGKGRANTDLMKSVIMYILLKTLENASLEQVLL